MPSDRPIVERAGTPFWRLAGSVETFAQLSPGSRSLKLIRPSDNLSSQIKFAMNAQSLLPAVQIQTQEGIVTVASAKIVNIKPPVQRPLPTGNKVRATFELEEIEIAFRGITINHRHRKGQSSDDWTHTG